MTPGQSQITIKVLCQETKVPLPYVTVSWNDGISGVVANETGEVHLPFLPETLLVSAVGFRDSVFYFEDSVRRSIMLYLTPVNFPLPEVEVRLSNVQKKTIEVKGKNKSRISSGSKYKFAIGTSVWIEKLSEIRTIKFYVESVGSNQPHKIRLRILKQDELMYPKYDILTDFVEFKPSKKGWNSFDLENTYLTIDSGYYLFALEWLFMEEGVIHEESGSPNSFRDRLQIRTSAMETSTNKRIWHRKDDLPWVEMNFENDKKFAPWMRIGINEYD